MGNLDKSFNKALSIFMDDVIVDGVPIGNEGAPEVNPRLAGPFCYFTEPEIRWLELYFMAGSFPLLSRSGGIGSEYARVSDLPRELKLEYRTSTPQTRDVIYDKRQKRFVITTNIRTNLPPDRFRFVIPPTETTTLELGVRQKRLKVVSYIATKDKIPMNIVGQSCCFDRDRFVLGTMLLLIRSIQHSSDSHLNENIAITLTKLNDGQLGFASDSGQRRFYNQEKWRQIGLLLENILWKYSIAYNDHICEVARPSKPTRS